MWHTAATRPAVQRMYFDECEEMWRPYRPKPSRSRALRRPTLHRSASRVLSAHAQGIFVKLSVAIALTITAILVVTNAALGSQEGAV